MRISKKQFYSFLMALVMLWSAVPIFVLPICAEDVVQAAVTEDDLRAAVEQQIRAFAKSINQSGADDAAAKALAKHGLSGGGKKLSVGKSHALTATLWNSEMMQQAMTETCAATAKYIQSMDLKDFSYVHGWCIWNGSQSYYDLATYISADTEYANRDFRFVHCEPYSGKRNSYDQSLDWMAGTTIVKVSFKQKKISATEITYEVVCTVSDRFDFSTSSNSGFKNLISGLAALLFREFDWESKVTFELTVPYSCAHSSGKYHWTYDRENLQFISDTESGYTPNNATRITYTNTKGENSYYYELAETIRLYHDKPWVLEYTVRNPAILTLSPLATSNCRQLSFIQYYRTYAAIRSMTRIRLSEEEAKKYGADSVFEEMYHEYGTLLQDLFEYSTQRNYTVRYENRIAGDGSNMIWLSIYDHTSQTQVLEVPMDDYFYSESWGVTREVKSTSSDGVCGQDIFINYIGNQLYRFSASYFDLCIWENGFDGEDGTFCTSKVTKPTCTKGGYTTYTCTLCGYSFTGDATPAAHSYKDKITAPTCTEKGFTTHTCSCGESYVDSYVEALSHSYKNGICSSCGAKSPVFYGDLDEDGVITTTDIVLLRRYIAGGYGVTLNPSAADLNSDGVLTSTDVVILRRYIAGGYGIELPNSAA